MTYSRAGLEFATEIFRITKPRPAAVFFVRVWIGPCDDYVLCVGEDRVGDVGAVRADILKARQLGGEGREGHWFFLLLSPV